MKKKIVLLNVLGLAALGTVLASGQASHAAATAFTGLAQNPSEATCFLNSSGAILNNCTGVRRYCVSDFIGTSGNHSVRVDGFRPNGGSFSCFAASVNEFGFNVTTTATATLAVVDTDAALTVGTVNVPGFGSLFLCCDLSQGAWLDTANF
jgi:hypothetical protein